MGSLRYVFWPFQPHLAGRSLKSLQGPVYVVKVGLGVGRGGSAGVLKHGALVAFRGFDKCLVGSLSSFAAPQHVFCLQLSNLAAVLGFLLALLLTSEGLFLPSLRPSTDEAG